MYNELRVAIVAHRFQCFGGIQTCFLELVLGLNDLGIVPEIIWDEPIDWTVFGNPGIQATFKSGRLGISSEKLRSFPTWLSTRLKPLSMDRAQLGLQNYDFIYCFEAGVKMPKGKPNLCYTPGPPLIKVPSEQIESKQIGILRAISNRTNISRTFGYHLDKNSHYVTISDWIAGLFEKKYCFRPPVIWPPARSRDMIPTSSKRSGFLFLSRLTEYKNAHVMLNLAQALPKHRISLAGVVQDHVYLLNLREKIKEKRLTNVEIIENPSEDQVSVLLASHEYFIFPAPWEHFGIVTVEAIQAGLIPIVHNSGGQREIVPIDSLRFQTEKELIDRVEFVITLSSELREKLKMDLYHNVSRSFPENYIKEMLRPLKALQSEI